MNYDFPSASVLHDHDVYAALESLERSTAAIEAQCSLLESQKSALKQLQSQNRESAISARARQHDQQSRLRRKAELDVETNDLAESIGQRLSKVRRETQRNVDALDPAVQRVLESDDRALERLQKVLPMLEDSGDQEYGAKVEEVGELARALVVLRTKAVRERINQVYLASLGRAENGGLVDRDAIAEGQAAELTEELDSLIAEVDSVVTMVVDHEFRRPILASLSQSQTVAGSQHQQLQQYVEESLRHMAGRLESLTMHAHDLRDYKDAVTAISDAYSTTTTTSQEREPASKTQKAQPEKTGLKPLLLRKPETSDAATQYLRQHSITAPKEPSALASTLASALSERRERIATLSASTSATIERQLVDAMAGAECDLQDLLEALYAFSPYGTLSTGDAELAGRLRELDVGIKEVSGEMAGVDIGRLVAAARRKQERLLGDS